MRQVEPNKLITVFGGSGFIGRYVVQLLAQKGYRVRVAVRRPNLALYLKPLGDVGQIQLFQANIRDAVSCRAALEGADGVVNLVGILQEGGAQRFASVQAAGAGLIAKLAGEAGITRFAHVSAIGADEESASEYARTKALGEEAVLKAVPTATILRPSIVFGPEDDFFNRFAAMARLSPALPLIGGGQTRFQPVYVKDVAAAILAALENDETRGKIYELGGPEVFSFKELMERMLEEIRRKRVLVSLPFAIAKLMGRIAGILPNAPLTADQVELLKTDNVVSDEAREEERTLAALGVPATGLDSVLSTYLYRFRRTGQFERREA